MCSGKSWRKPAVRAGPGGTHEPMAPSTWAKVALALVPRAVMATRQTTIIRANITAYSTAVGPSSVFRNVRRQSAKHVITYLHSGYSNGVASSRMQADGMAGQAEAGSTKPIKDSSSLAGVPRKNSGKRTGFTSATRVRYQPAPGAGHVSCIGRE